MFTELPRGGTPPDGDAKSMILPALFAELCCGVGGLTKGFIDAGLRCVVAIDNWAAALAVHRANLGNHAALLDLSATGHVVSVVRGLRPLVVAGGPPCQDFSAAGRRVEGERASVTLDFATACAAIRSEWIVMENVPRARRSKAWQEACAILREAGYGLTVVVLNAALYGVPQRRRRLFVIGRLGERAQFLESALRNAAAPREMTIRDRFTNRFGDHLYAHPCNPGRRGVVSADGPFITVRDARRPQPPGYRPHPGDSNYVGGLFFRGQTGVKAVFGPDEPAPTILRTTREKPRETHMTDPHPDDHSPAAEAYVLTQSEMALIQGFPEDWDWSPAARVRDVDQMIANAVPPPLAQAIAGVILRRHRGDTIPEIEGNYGQWLAKKRGMNAQMVANMKWRLRRAWMMLGGRTYADPAREMAALELSPTFKAMPARMQSSFRTALRLYRIWMDMTPAERRKRPR